MMLDSDKTLGIMKLGGTILGTTNKGHFVAKVGEGNVSQVPVEVVEKAKNTLRHLEVGALIVVGGDGSLTTGLQLYQMGIPVIGVPKTIDNDIQATATSFGFDSAVATVVDALDRLHTTAESHKRVIVLEVMGRHAGWIALYGGMAGGADVILLPESPSTLSMSPRPFANAMPPGCTAPSSSWPKAPTWRPANCSPKNAWAPRAKTV
jgi:6-phosphofructokinase